MKIVFIAAILFTININAFSNNIQVGRNYKITSIREALSLSENGDTISVYGGLYMEGNIIIVKSVCLIGVNNPIIDGDRKSEVLSIKANNVSISGFKIQHSSYATLDDPGGVKVYESEHVKIFNNLIYDNFFGIYIQYSKNCEIRENTIIAFGKQEQEIGNGIHCWKSDSLLIIGNYIKGNRDGIYFEFVTNSVIWRNVSEYNIRYGLHFMFSHNDAYYTNVFRSNGAGVAVMYTRKVSMMNNTFENNWGDASYGILLKDISDSYIFNNKFMGNTTAIYMDGVNRTIIEFNNYTGNGWGLKIHASCMDNKIWRNNFTYNTFDVSTNGNVILNEFVNNYWSKYEGYDLNKDNIGDVLYRPLSLFSVIAERSPPAMLLYNSLMTTLLDKSEKVFPSLTPADFIDNFPAYKPYKI